jgi:ATP-binding cassette subfamily B protein
MKFTPQHDQMDCGPACLSMIADHYGKEYSIQYLRDLTFITREGVSMLGITYAAKQIGLNTFSAMLSFDMLIKLLSASKIPFPCIIHWNQTHFVVLTKIKRNPLSKKYIFELADPGHGFISLSEEKFRKSWLSEKDEGVALFLEPKQEFFTNESQRKKKYPFQIYLETSKTTKNNLSLFSFYYY